MKSNLPFYANIKLTVCDDKYCIIFNKEMYNMDV